MRWLMAGGIMGAALASTAAQAQVAEGVDLSGPESASVTSRWFTADALEVRGHNRWAVGSSLAWSHRPLVIWDAATNEELAVIVRHQVYFRPGVAWTLWDRVRVDAQLPMLVVNDGGTAVAGPTVYESEQGAAFGDAKLAALAMIAGEPGEAVRLGAGVRAWLPTGSQQAYAGSGTTSLGPVAHVAGDIGTFTYGANLGVTAFMHEQRVGTRAMNGQLAMNVAAGVRLLDERLTVGPELSIETGLDGGTFFEEETTPAELMAGVHYATDAGWLMGLGLGTGLDGAVGTPELRGQASLTWIAEPEPADRDGDGYDDRIDQCPDVEALAGAGDPMQPGCPRPADGDGDRVADPEDQCPELSAGNAPDPNRAGCPLAPDQDQDGTVDEQDQCPERAATGESMDPARPGCPLPLDRDGDGVEDERDACPDEAPSNGAFDPVRPGCALADRDRDGVLDADDACPDEAAPEASSAERRGCPVASVSDSEIRIGEQIQFEMGTAQLSADSDGVLGAIAKLLNEHPEISLVSIEGHSDSSGNPAVNMRLSAERARTVHDRLVALGVDPARLKHAGLGDSQPIASNDDELGRAKNRRVQFVILSRSTGGASDAPR